MSIVGEKNLFKWQALNYYFWKISYLSYKTTWSDGLTGMAAKVVKYLSSWNFFICAKPFNKPGIYLNFWHANENSF